MSLHVCAGVQSLCHAIYACQSLDSGSCQYENYAINDLSIYKVTQEMTTEGTYNCSTCIQVAGSCDTIVTK